jgi:hypothetical protein
LGKEGVGRFRLPERRLVLVPADDASMRKWQRCAFRGVVFRVRTVPSVAWSGTLLV